MKKAKFMLFGIGVLGVAGGALALNAKKFTGNLYCTGIESGAATTDFTYKATVPGGDAQRLYCTDLQHIANAGTVLVTVSENF